jgi:hypothetical protein
MPRPFSVHALKQACQYYKMQGSPVFGVNTSEARYTRTRQDIQIRIKLLRILELKDRISLDDNIAVGMYIHKVMYGPDNEIDFTWLPT